MSPHPASPPSTHIQWHRLQSFKGGGSVVVDSLLIVAPIWSLFCYAELSVRSSFGIRENTGCFTLIVFLMFCDCQCSALHHDAMRWFVVCDSGIFKSYFLNFPRFLRLIFSLLNHYLKDFLKLLGHRHCPT